MPPSWAAGATDEDGMSLAALEARLRRELHFVSYPTRPWMVRREHPDGPVLDVVIVGGGQSGLAAAFGLRREAVTNVVVLDRNPAGREGPWRTFARMITLRTPKIITGLDFGMPALTPRAWYEAQWGEDAWQKLDKFPARGLAGLPRLVSPRARAAGAEQRRGDRHRAARRLARCRGE